MTCTLWSNGGKHEWIMYKGDEVVARSGLIFNSKRAAQKALAQHLKETP